MSGSVTFHNRALQPFLAPHGLHVSPQRYSWHALGGPEWAELSVRGASQDLWRLLDWLRYGVQIRNAHDELVWWGYVEAVSLAVGALQIGVSLETMHNRVAVVYSYVEPGTQNVGTRATTAWAQDADSIARYGVKEVLASIDGATGAQAENARDVLLAQRRVPVPMPNVGGETPQTRIFCRGWWDTLRWRYYANGATDSVATTAQIAHVVSESGQFLSGVDVVHASGITASEYRDGDSTAQDVLVNLLRTGTHSGQRLLATVTPERLLRVDAEPQASSVALFVTADGRVVDRLGRPLPDGTLPAGRWLALKDVPVGALFGTQIAGPSPFFVERAEYDVQRGALHWEPRGLPSVWELARLEDG